MKNFKTVAAAVFALVLVAACNSTNPIFGGSNASAYEIRGTVDQVDVNSHSIYLRNVSGNSSMLSSSGGDSVRVFYDNQTTVSYQGKSYRPDQLDRGDQVSVQVDESGNRLNAESMTLLYNSMGSSYPAGSTSPNGTYSSTVRGTVRYVDASRRTIQIDQGNGALMTVDYDTNTPVYFNGKTYMPSQLEAGDQIDVRISNSGGGRVLAQDITVIRNVNGGGYGTGSTQTSTIRGTVGYIDTARHTIQLTSTNWVAGFNPSSGTGATMIVQYDTNTSVDVRGNLYPVTNLERGDVIDVQVQNLGGSTVLAQRITLVRDVNGRY